MQYRLAVSRLVKFLRHYKDVHNINSNVLQLLVSLTMLNLCSLNEGIVFFIIYFPQQTWRMAELNWDPA